MPVFNREKTLARSVQSIIAQTYKDWMLMIVDDGSTDNSPEVIKRLVAEDDRIRSKSNTEYSHSCAGARLAGLIDKTGKYVAFLDSDDTWPEYHLEEFVEFLESNIDVDYVFGDIKRVNQWGKTLVGSKFKDENGIPLELEITWDGIWGKISLNNSTEIAIKSRFNSGMHTALFKKHFFDKVPLRDVYGCEDALLTMESLNKGMHIVICNKIHLNYLVHDENVSSVGTNMSFEHSEKNSLSEIDFYENLIPLYINLNKCEDNARMNKLAGLYVWHLAYNTYVNFGKYQEALTYIGKGIKIRPFNIQYYKTYISTLLKAAYKSL
tara:strand:+ start:8513 stop:9481 length:969 start_codon:yes stop_codon:yes gene_type:complete